MRSCGVLLHITSLPSPYGIGTFGEQAEKFVDWLVSAGQEYWQVLPIGPTGYGDSPYQSFSTFAGNPLLIDPDDLVKRGLVTKEMCGSADFGSDPSFVDYDKVTRAKMALLRQAYSKFTADGKYTAFEKNEAYWLDDYSLYMAIKEENQLVSWLDWSDDLRLRKPEALAESRVRLKDSIGFWKFVQYIFYAQWEHLKACANGKGIKIIGDIPIYVSPDGSDIWANTDLFETDEEKRPKRVAGVPPDYFSATGQLWGNPLYRWDIMKEDGFSWWISRIEKAAKLYDLVRIDHFRAFDTYWAIPAGEETAINGKWEQGPGMDLWNAVRDKLGNVPIIAEDLGDIFDSVKELLKASGFPGMRVLQFGFNPNSDDNDHLPHRYVPNSVCYTGTHDNSTVVGWYKAADEKSRAMCRRYLKPGLFEKINLTMIRELYKSTTGLAIVPMQDIIGLDDRARMNIPSTLGGNWKWRALPKHFSEKSAAYLRELAETYYRLPEGK
ncbi:MAG: 4-alpha-glucanotransferase [Ruminiclostridium sp.]|nr:4-alpha-glucanotransferase [Ruminiclostridium sp.]